MSFLNGPKSFLFSGEASGNKLATPEAVNRIITIYFLRRLPRHFFFFFFFFINFGRKDVCTHCPNTARRPSAWRRTPSPRPPQVDTPGSTPRRRCTGRIRTGPPAIAPSWTPRPAPPVGTQQKVRKVQRSAIRL